MVNIDWSQVRCCGASGLDEYYCIDTNTDEIRNHHVHPKGDKGRRGDGKFYYFCEDQYRTPNSIDLCVNCCRKLGIIW